MVVVRGSKEPEAEQSASGSSDAAGSAPAARRSVASLSNGAADSRPEGGSGEWLQQFAWALEDNNLEAAAHLLRWILGQGEPWAAVQAAELAIDRLAQVPEGRGAAATLVRLYHGLGTLFPESHPFHGAFLEKLEAQVRVLAPGSQALTASTAIERALELFRGSLSTHDSYDSLRSALAELQDRSHRVVQREQERELETLLASGQHEAALELCRDLVRTYQSPLASGLMPALLAQSATYVDRMSAKSDRRSREWDWPELGADAHTEGLRYDPRTGRPLAPGLEPDPEPPRVAWARTFDEPPPPQPDEEEEDEDASSRYPIPGYGESAFVMRSTTEATTRLQPVRRALDPEEPGTEPPPRTVVQLKDPREPAVVPTVAPVGASTALEPRPLETAPPIVPTPPRRRVGLMVLRFTFVLALIFLAALGGWWTAHQARDAAGVPVSQAPEKNEPHAGESASAAKPVEVARSALDEVPLGILEPPPDYKGPPAFLTLEINPADRLELYLDGHLQADGMVQKLTVNPGRHIVEVYREAYEKYQQEIDAAAGGEAKFQITLQKSPTLSFDVQPSDGIDLSLDGRSLTLAPPVAGYIISPGKHRLEVARPGSQSHVEDFTAPAGADLNFQIELKPRL